MSASGIRPASGNAPAALARAPRSEPGRLTALALLGGAAGGIPIPFLPTAAMRSVRGALAHDVAARRGLSLTPAARRALADPPAHRRGALVATAAFLARRAFMRVGALALLPPITAWLEAYALGLLFDRYLERVRTSRAVRIDEAEARRVRRAIEAALARAISPSVRADAAPSAEAPEELRDTTTRILDGLLIGLSSLPSHLQRRIEAAFDAIVLEEEDLRRG